MMRHFMILTILFFSSASDAREVELSWEAFEQALGYHVLVSKTPDFKEIVVKKASTEPKIIVPLEIGTYFYKVRAVDKDKTPGYWSEPMKFSVDPYPPELKLPKNDVEYGYFEVPPQIDFEWKAVEDGPEYEVYVYKTTGKKAFEGKTKDTKLSVNSLEEGEYMWKVRTIYKDIFESPYGEPRRFNIEKRELQKPVLIKPDNDADAPAYQPIQLEWQRDPVARFTDVSLKYLSDEDGSEKNLEVPKNLDSADSYLLDFAEPGVYTWSVKTKEGENTPGLTSEEAKFKVRKDIVSNNDTGFYFGLGYQTTEQNYKTTRFGSAQKGTTQLQGWVNHAGGYYYFATGFGLQLDMYHAPFENKDGRYPYSGFTASTRLRIGTPGFNQQFVFGYRQANAFEILDGGYQLYTTNGAVVGTQFMGTVAKSVRVTFGGLYYKPLNHVEGRAKFNADIYEGHLNVAWNIAYKFWLSYEFSYQKGVYQITPAGNPDSVYTKWDETNMIPAMIKFSFEN